jgi:hypothetical protein
LTLLLAWGCSPGPAEVRVPDDGSEANPPLPADTLPTGWTWTRDIPLVSSVVSDYPHDNLILRSPHFLTYSDGGSRGDRIRFATMAEEAFAEVTAFFQLPPEEDMGIRPEDVGSRFQIIWNVWEERPQRSYRFGFLLHALDSRFAVGTSDSYARMVKHETIHVFHGYLMGPTWNVEDPWFKEGLAEFGADGGFFGSIGSVAELRVAWELLEGAGLDPLNMEIGDLAPRSGEIRAAAYRIWGLAFRFLLDPGGQGRSIQDVVALFRDVREEVLSFSLAFETHLGISREAYESKLYARLEEFLE